VQIGKTRSTKLVVQFSIRVSVWFRLSVLA